MNAKEQISHAMYKFINSEPFFAELLFRMDFVYSNKVPTMGVTIENAKIKLYVNEEFIKDKSTDEVADILKHECMHIISDHLVRGKEFGKENQMRYNVAADLAINHLLPETAEKHGATVAKFNKHHNANLEDRQLTEYYYSHLPEEMGEDMQTIDSHELWEDIESSAIAREVIKETVKSAVSAIKRSGGAGNMSSELQELLDALLAPKVKWKSQLRMFVTNAIAYTKTPTRKKRNRRYGILFAGKKKEKKAKIVICNDTSGSVSMEQLAQFYTEIEAISKYIDDITIIEADCEIKQIYKYVPGMKITVSGRGGTSFLPSLAKAEELKADGIIFFTDGDNYEELPEKKIKIPILWALTQDVEKPFGIGNKLVLGI